MKRKLFSGIISFSICLSLFNTNIADIQAKNEEEISYVHSKVTDDYRYVPVNKNLKFSEDKVIIYIKHQYSELNKVWDKKDFNIDGITDIEDLTYLHFSKEEQEKYLKNVTFRQTLAITFEDGSVEKVCNVIESLASIEEVMMALPNYIEEISSEEYLNSNITNTNNYAFELLQVQEAWQNYTSGSSNVKVGVIDTGVNNSSYLSSNLVAGYNVFALNNNTTDINGHGTEVASVIGGSTTGVCQNVSIVPIKITGQESGQSNQSTSAIYKARALQYANDHHIPIVNLSYACREQDSYQYEDLDSAISNYDGLVVVSSGNWNLNVDTNSYKIYPTAFECENQITVAASDQNDNISTSVWGPVSVDLAAPGSSISVVTVSGSINNGGGGSSIAAPFVTGTAALLLSYNPDLTTAQLKYAIMNSVDHSEDFEYEHPTVTEGRLNIYKALQYVTPANKYRNYILRTAVTASFNYSSALIYLEHMEGLYDLYDIQAGNLLGSNSHIGYVVQYDTWWTRRNAISVSNIAYGLSGDIARIRLKSRFLKDYNDISNDISFSSNRSGIIPKYILLGDINSDGVINNSDSLLLSRALSGTYTLSANAKISADTNQNGAVDSNDLIKLNNYINNTINTFF